MKKLWKILGITALAASLIPYRVDKDDETESTTVDALLWQATRRPGQGEDKGQLDISIGFKSPLQAKREESALFADDEPEAAVVEVIADKAEAVAEEVEAKAAELEAKVEELGAKAAEAVEAAVEEVIAGAEDEEAVEPAPAEEAAEEGFDPEL